MSADSEMCPFQVRTAAVYLCSETEYAGDGGMPIVRLLISMWQLCLVLIAMPMCEMSNAKPCVTDD